MRCNMDRSDRRCPYILLIPIELQEKIILYMTYDEISRLRRVCKTFDRVCQNLLNKGFASVEKYHTTSLRIVKSQLPRRESERRNHSLARHCDILNSIETRLSLLSMTFVKYIDVNLCCFIPGKVIDEIFRVLRIINSTTCVPRAHEILQELRDISSMAMEHFDEKIVPSIKQKMITSTAAHFNLSPSSALALQTSFGMLKPSLNDLPFTRGLRAEFLKIQQTCKQNSVTVVSIKKELSDNKTKGLSFEKKIQEQEKTILELNHLIADQNEKISEQEGRINEMNRKFLEYDQRSADLLTELSRSDVVRTQRVTVAVRQPKPELFATKSKTRSAAKRTAASNESYSGPLTRQKRRLQVHDAMVAEETVVQKNTRRSFADRKSPEITVIRNEITTRMK